MIPKQVKQTMLNALRGYRGDDLYRAKAAFRNLSEEQMQEQYGQSGKTRQEIIEGYQAHETRCDEAQEWIDGQVEA